MKYKKVLEKIKREELLGKVALLFYVCRAWQLTWWCKSTMGVCSDQPLAQGKGVYREENPKEAGGKVPV